MVKLMLLKLIEVSDESALPARMVESLDSYIRENCSDEISNTEIGAIFGYHPFYVSRLLKDKKGMTLRQYVIAYRLKRAKRLLEVTDKTTQEIADECGFTDASYFSKSFKSAFGVSPRDYRNDFKNEFI
jgi:two-component system response regulator YesN